MSLETNEVTACYTAQTGTTSTGVNSSRSEADSVDNCIFDENGNYTTQEEFDTDDDGKIDLVTYQTYNENNKMIQREFDNNNDGEIDKVFYFYYDNNGKMVGRVTDDDNDGTIDSYSSFTYNEDGSKTNRTFCLSEEGNVDAVITEEVGRDYTSSYINDGGDGTIDSAYYCEYDENGNLIKEEDDNNYDGTIDETYILNEETGELEITETQQDKPFFDKVKDFFSGLFS